MAQFDKLPATHYLMYLRKSRKDRELESATGVADTLQRHRDTLLSLAKNSGYEIAHIYEEVASGDTIAERPEMQKLLAAVETGLYAGVLVMEVARLARGNTRDQGIVAETFEYSSTKIITPDRTYDPADEADGEYFEFGLFMSRREYKSINRRQQRGRLASLGEGKYIAAAAPYGYERVKLPAQKGWSLQILPEKAEVVRQIFALYTVGELQPDGSRRTYGAYTIANLLNERLLSSPSGKPWTSSAVRELLSNPTYAGYVRWGYRAVERRMRDGIVVESRPLNKDVRLIQGLHAPIISKETWELACRLRASRSHRPIPPRTQLSNPLAGILTCSVCGRSMLGMPQRKANRREWLMLKCPTAKCPGVGSPLETVETALLNGLRQWLENYRADSDAFVAVGQDASLATSTREIARLGNELSTIQAQQDALYDLLEQGVYNRDLFVERSQILAAKTAAISRAIEEAEARLQTERISLEHQMRLLPNMEKVLEAYDMLTSPAEKNDLLKEVLEKVIYSKRMGGRWAENDLQLYLFPKLQPLEDDR